MNSLERMLDKTKPYSVLQLIHICKWALGFGFVLGFLIFHVYRIYEQPLEVKAARENLERQRQEIILQARRAR